MKKLLTLAIVFSTLLVIVPASADPGTLYVDAAGICGGASTCYLHPQDAVNAANPGDIIKVYPGVYGSREAPHSPPHWGPNDWFAPALIVYKNDLTIEAVDPDPANTIIQSTHNFWSNPVAIQWSTGGTFNPGPHGWDAYYTTPPGITPNSGTAPSAVAIIASGVTIRGFTFHRPFEGTNATSNTAGVMIGGLYAGGNQFLGSDNNTVENNVFSDVWHAVYIWHSSGNTIRNNTVAALTTNHWAAISTYDGYNDAQIGLGHPSENNLIVHNTLANKGISLGAWDPPTWTSNAGSKVCFNTTTQVGVGYAHGLVIVGCNTGGFWQYNTDNVLRVTGITYTGDTLSGSGAVNLSAQLAYDGSVDGSGVSVVFTVGGTDYPATTVAGGSASTMANLGPGVYNVQVKVAVCDACEFSDTQFLVVYDPSAGFVTGGGWIYSPPGAYAAGELLEGKATFGFVSKYQKGATVPTGNTEFQFKAGDLNFHSTSYEWLVVAGARAQFKGVGTINGAGEYSFMLTAIDGQVSGGGGVDKFRIKIWDAGGVVYDNKMGADDAGNDATELGGGSIVIHK